MDLNGTWKLYFYPCYEQDIITVEQLQASGLTPINATVPGNVELDLSAAGYLPADLFYGTNIVEAEKYERYDWWYETEIDAPPAPRADQDVFLHFGAVDCYADYFLNGEKIGESANMFIAQDFDVTDKLLYGQKNSLHVHIYSAVVKASETEVEPNCTSLSDHITTDSLNSRKAAHSYGWDIMPRAVSAGIWRDVRLEYKNKCRFRYFHLETSRILDNGDAELRLSYDLHLTKKYVLQPFTLTVNGACGDRSFSFQKAVQGRAMPVIIHIPDPKLWWPKHYGEPNLYDIHIELVSEDGKVTISEDTKFGLRTVALKHSDMVEEGGCFDIIVNGTRIMAMGSNWVPMDVYHSRDKDRYAKALDMADDLGCNILRCWGGNVYEDQAFFDYCDAHGIMVWQDFAMACHYYPQTEAFFRAMEEEAAWVIKAYFNHPSLILWSGDNEIDGQTAAKGVDPGENRITREILPRMVHRFDPHRPYIASSPYVSSKAFHSGSVEQGSRINAEDHLWGPRAYHKDAFFRDSQAYFVSESGYHGCPARSTLESYIDADRLWPYTENVETLLTDFEHPWEGISNIQWDFHSTTPSWDINRGRVLLMFKQVKQLFGEIPTTLDGFILASQICQAEAKKYFIERIRVNMARNGGIIWWNLMDGWPQESDAVVDYYYEKKLAYDFIKRSQQGFMIMADELKQGWTQELVCCNSTQETVSGKCTVYDIDTNEVVVECAFTARPNANTLLQHFPSWHSDVRMLVIRWEVDGKVGYNTHLCGTPPFDFQRFKGWVEKLKQL